MQGGDVQTSKKHCPGEARKPKTKPTASKDPQSIAAKVSFCTYKFTSKDVTKSLYLHFNLWVVKKTPIEAYFPCSSIGGSESVSD